MSKNKDFAFLNVKVPVSLKDDLLKRTESHDVTLNDLAVQAFNGLKRQWKRSRKASATPATA